MPNDKRDDILVGQAAKGCSGYRCKSFEPFCGDGSAKLVSEAMQVTCDTEMLYVSLATFLWRLPRRRG
jgi:hypothetical protein